MNESQPDKASSFRLAQASLPIALVVASLPLWLNLPVWFRATWVGCCWGALIIAGLQLSWSRSRAWAITSAATMSWIGYLAMSRVFELDSTTARLLTLLLVAGGWIIGVLKSPWTFHGEASERTAFVCTHRPSLSRWTLWDIGCLTAFTAAFCGLWPQFDQGLDVACQLAPALVGGWLLCLVAIDWAWKDRWTIGGLVALAAIVMTAISLPIFMHMQKVDPWLVVAWFVAGPGSVIAAEAMAVLCYLAALRAA